jgi:hypothetical protein
MGEAFQQEFAAGRVGVEGPVALAWRLALRVGIMLLQQKLKLVIWLRVARILRGGSRPLVHAVGPRALRTLVGEAILCT